MLRTVGLALLGIGILGAGLVDFSLGILSRLADLAFGAVAFGGVYLWWKLRPADDRPQLRADNERLRIENENLRRQVAVAHRGVADFALDAQALTDGKRR